MKAAAVNVLRFRIQRIASYRFYFISAFTGRCICTSPYKLHTLMKSESIRKAGTVALVREMRNGY
jgi:hypothetical protein